ncbi:MAG: putative aminodeoxychorismate lyase [Syntrophus sp. PtaU1.Bin208]|nr:MAG: putative aminodeoxychorismate lyase [Syntrophus sp. PtaU1.Bin208]
MRSGAYTFSGKMTPLAMVNKLSRGEIDVCRITIHEDMNLKEIADHLARLHLVDEKKFLSLAEDRTFLRSLGIEEGSAEGYLYPDTYFFDDVVSPEELIRRIVGQFWRVVNPEMRDKARQMGMTMNQFVTLASLIGKETGFSAEKPIIAAVFFNRLKKGMRLQSDPTAVYHLAPFEGKITRRHLLTPTPHNTYFIKGLPPSPIANPGKDSLLAAINPAKVEYLYFVSNGSGSHQFSTTLEAHNHAVLRYRLAKEKGE